MPRILVIATSRKTRGGITSVIKAHELGEQWKKYHCHWIQTHRDGNLFVKIIYFVYGLIDFCIRLPFYDLVHIHFSLKVTAKRKKIFVLFSKIFKKKIIAHLHCGTQIDEIWNADYDYIFKNSDIGIVLSESLKKIVNSHLKYNKDIRVLYNPCPFIDSKRIYPKKNYILFSGTICKGKGYIDLIKAFSLIAYKYSDWKIIFAGNGEIEYGKQLTCQLKIDNQVDFYGWISGDIKDRVFKESLIFCLPSYAEGFPMAVLDAWAYGLPVITTPVGGIPDIAENGENILLFNPGDIQTLASHLERMISDDNLRSKIAIASKNFAEKRFNVNTINKQLGDIYEELLN